MPTEINIKGTHISTTNLKKNTNQSTLEMPLEEKHSRITTSKAFKRKSKLEESLTPEVKQESKDGQR